MSSQLADPLWPLSRPVDDDVEAQHWELDRPNAEIAPSAVLTLRLYQQKIVDDVHAGWLEASSQIIPAPTGAGKAEVACALALDQKTRGKRTLFIVERIVLASQSLARFEKYGLRVGLVQGANTRRVMNEDVLVVSAQSLTRRMSRLTDIAGGLGLIIIDEAHILHRVHCTLFDKLSAVPRVGLTATPERPDLGFWYQRVAFAPTMRWMVDSRFLVPLLAYGPRVVNTDDVGIVAGDFDEKALSRLMRERAVVGDTVQLWQQLGENRPTLVFCVDVAHAKAVHDQFTSEGISCGHIDAKTTTEERDALFRLFESGQIKVLTSVGVLAVGFDAPIASCAIMARPTMSIALFIQQAGRVLRLHYETKRHAILIDQAGNVARHGFPVDYEPPNPLYKGKPAAKCGKRKLAPKAVPCSNCGLMLEPGLHMCSGCGTLRERHNGVHFVGGDLVNLDTRARVGPAVDQVQYLRELMGFVIGRGRKPGSVWHMYKKRFGTPPDQRAMRMAKKAPIEPSLPVQRFAKSCDIAWRKSRGRRIQNERTARHRASSEQAFVDLVAAGFIPTPDKPIVLPLSNPAASISLIQRLAEHGQAISQMVAEGIQTAAEKNRAA